MMKKNGNDSRFAICVDNAGYKASLIVRKVYPLVADADAERRGLVRIVDESGEDYLFPAQLLVPIKLPKSAGRAFQAGNLTSRSTRRPLVSRALRSKARATRSAG